MGGGGGGHEHEALSPLWPVTRAAYGSASSRVLDGLSSEPEFKAFWFKNKTLSIKIWKKWGGGGGGGCSYCAPASIHYCVWSTQTFYSFKSKTVNCKRCTTQQQYQGLGRKHILLHKLWKVEYTCLCISDIKLNCINTNKCKFCLCAN